MAEAQVRALAQHALPDLATKDDLKLLAAELRADLARFEGRIDNRLAGIDGRISGIKGRLANCRRRRSSSKGRRSAVPVAATSASRRSP